MTDEKTTDVTEETEVTEVEEVTEAVEEETAAADSGAAETEEFEFAEDPSFEIDYKGDCAYEVKVTVPNANEKKQSEELFDELIKEAQVPGFRKGKAPRGLVVNKFGKAVRAESMEKIVGATVRKLVKDEDLKPLDFPEIEGLEGALDRDADAPLSFTMKFEVYPRCELGTYRGIEVEQPVLKVEAADVDAAILDMRGRFATFEVIEEAAVAGDQVIIDFEGKIDGELFAGGAAENYPYIIGSGRFFKEFEAALPGAKAGEEKTCDVPFPEDYSNKVLAGKTAQFTIKIHEVKRRQTPEFDDAFAKQAGFESAAAMRERVENDLREGASEQSRAIGERRAIEKIVEESTFELPKSLVESSANEYYEQERRRLAALHVPNSELNEREEKLREEARENAVKNIQSFVVVNEIGEAEGIEIDEDDFLKEAEAIQKRTGMDMDVVSRYLQQRDQHNDYRSRIFHQKALAVVMDNAKVTFKEVTREELEKEYEQEDA